MFRRLRSYQDDRKPNTSWRVIPTVHATLLLLMFWALAFLTLGLALVLLNIFCAVVGNDLELKSAGSEVVIAGVAALIEALSFWTVVTFVPLAARALILPALIVAVIYKVAHYEDWGRYDVFLLLIFQGVIVFAGASVFLGHFETAVFVLVGFGMVLALLAAFARGLWD